MINPLQSALSSALSGVRTATQESGAAAEMVVRATLASPDTTAGSESESMAPPELYAAVTQQLQTRGKFMASLDMLKTADRMLAETVRTL